MKDIIHSRTTPGNGWWEELQCLPSVSVSMLVIFARMFLL
jgi:hypothetical protein